MNTVSTTSRHGYILERRTEYGHAARRNRGRYVGRTIHRIIAEYIVGLEPGSEHRPGTYGATFQRTGKPVLYYAAPACHCTQGSHAAQPLAGLTAADVTCKKCLPPPNPPED